MFKGMNRICKRVVKEGGYNTLEFFSGAHDHERTVVYINVACRLEWGPNGGDWLRFPLRDHQIRLVSNKLVLVPVMHCNVFIVEIESGYRGTATIDEVSGEIMARGAALHSGQGALGRTAWAIVNCPEERLRVSGQATGRRIAAADEKQVFDLGVSGDRTPVLNDALMAAITDAPCACAAYDFDPCGPGQVHTCHGEHGGVALWVPKAV